MIVCPEGYRGVMMCCRMQCAMQQAVLHLPLECSQNSRSMGAETVANASDWLEGD